MSASSTEQGTPEWFAARLGRVTASRIVDVLATGKGGQPSASRYNYAAELVAERLTGKPYPHFQSAAMLRGSEQEAACRAAYELITGNVITLEGFVPHPTVEMAGASPDGLVGDDGLYEAKNPNTATHMRTLLGASIDRGYLLQMQWQMACTGRQWCDWVSYDERMPEHLQLKVLRVDRDPMRIAEVTREVVKFLAEVDDLERQLRAIA
jgi:predicted phage-related endonuclease